MGTNTVPTQPLKSGNSSSLMADFRPKNQLLALDIEVSGFGQELDRQVSQYRDSSQANARPPSYSEEAKRPDRGNDLPSQQAEAHQQKLSDKKRVENDQREDADRQTAQRTQSQRRDDAQQVSTQQKQQQGQSELQSRQSSAQPVQSQINTSDKSQSQKLPASESETTKANSVSDLQVAAIENVPSDLVSNAEVGEADFFDASLLAGDENETAGDELPDLLLTNDAPVINPSNVDDVITPEQGLERDETETVESILLSTEQSSQWAMLAGQRAAEIPNDESSPAEFEEPAIEEHKIEGQWAAWDQPLKTTTDKIAAGEKEGSASDAVSPRQSVDLKQWMVDQKREQSTDDLPSATEETLEALKPEDWDIHADKVNVATTDKASAKLVNMDALPQTPVQERLAALAKAMEKPESAVKSAAAKGADLQDGSKSATLQRSEAPSRASVDAVKTMTSQIQTPMASREWASEMGQKLLMMVSSRIQQAQIQLNPNNMGTIDVKVSMQKDQASITFTAAMPQTREALEQALPRLREMFEQNAGVDLANVDVQDQAAHQSHQQQARDQHQQRSNGVSTDNADDETLMEVSLMEGAGIVDYYA